MIKSFRHKGLENFFRLGVKNGINANHAEKLRLILAMLDNAVEASDMNAPGLRFHRLLGDRNKTYSVTVNRNWRITFEFFDGNAYILNYEDYH